VGRRVSPASAAPPHGTIDAGKWTGWLARLLAGPKALRVDVHQHPDTLRDELDELHQRLSQPGDALCGLPSIQFDFPGFVFRYREADGEHYIYVEDVCRGRLAGYTVFNRLVEINRQADRHLRAPHSKYAREYQRRGIATAVYRWWLDAGNCLISGARQSAGAHALWRSLGRRYPLMFVQVRAKQLRFLGTQVDAAVSEDLDTRIVLVGAGWTCARLEAFIRLPAEITLQAAQACQYNSGNSTIHAGCRHGTGIPRHG
jgi:hypothetical protein